MKQKGNATQNKKSLPEIAEFFWEMENPDHVGLQDDGTYKPYGDPNGRDKDAGPGLVVGSAIDVRPSYTKGYLDTVSYNYFNNSMNKIGFLYDKKYGQG